MSAPLCLARKALALASALCALQPAPLPTLEITATSLMGDLTVVLGALNALREVGVKFTHRRLRHRLPSLAYLGTLPIDSLKIGRSLVIGMHEKPQNRLLGAQVGTRRAGACCSCPTRPSRSPPSSR